MTFSVFCEIETGNEGDINIYLRGPAAIELAMIHASPDLTIFYRIFQNVFHFVTSSICWLKKIKCHLNKKRNFWLIRSYFRH